MLMLLISFRPFLSLSHGVWRLDSWNKTLVVLTSPVSFVQDVSFIMDMTQYEYPNALQSAFSVHKVDLSVAHFGDDDADADEDEDEDDR